MANFFVRLGEYMIETFGPDSNKKIEKADSAPDEKEDRKGFIRKLVSSFVVFLMVSSLILQFTDSFFIASIPALIVVCIFYRMDLLKDVFK